MSDDFKDLLNKTLERIDAESYKASTQEYELICGHTVKGHQNSLIISGAKAGLSRHKSIQVCPRCAYILNDKSDPEYLIVKNLIRKKASL